MENNKEKIINKAIDDNELDDVAGGGCWFGAKAVAPDGHDIGCTFSFSWYESWSEYKYKNGICAKTSPTGNIVISLYNTDRMDHTFHCGTYLHDKYGGGGHEGAAGATISIETFAKILKTKKI